MSDPVVRPVSPPPPPPPLVPPAVPPPPLTLADIEALFAAQAQRHDEEIAALRAELTQRKGSSLLSTLSAIWAATRGYVTFTVAIILPPLLATTELWSDSDIAEKFHISPGAALILSIVFATLRARTKTPIFSGSPDPAASK